MNRPAIFRRMLLVVTLAAIGGGASGDSCSLNDIGKGGGGDQPTFVATLAVRDASGSDRDIFDVGQPISLVLSVRNRRNSTETATFTTTRTSDFVVVENGTDNIVWQQSGGQTGTPTATQIQFGPLETKTFTATWNQLNNAGAQVDTGTYEARGVLVYDGFDGNPLSLNETGSIPIEFSIQNLQ